MKSLIWITAIVVATLVGVVLAWELRVVILVFLFSLWTAAALRPNVDWLNRHGVGRRLSLALTYLIGLMLVAGMALLVALPLANELKRLGDEAVVSYEDLAKRWEHGSQFQQAMIRRLPVPEKIFQELAGNQGLLALQSVLGFTFGVFDAGVHLVIVVVLSLYWSMDRVHFERLWLSLLGVKQRIEARAVWRDIEAEVGGYLRSEVVQCVVAGLLLAAGYYLLDYPYPVLMAVIAAVCWLIPWLGVLFAVLIGLLLALPTMVTEGSQSTFVGAIASALLTLAVLLAMEIWIEPRFFQRRRYNPLLTVIMVVALADAFGIVGLLLGPPVAAAVQIVGAHLLRRQIAAQSSAHKEHMPPLDERLTAVRTALASVADPPAGLVSLVNRLETLVNEAQEVAASPPGGAAETGYVRAQPAVS